MQCINKIKAGWTRSGELTFSKKKHDPGQVGLEFECRKCLACRLNTAREKAIRAIHEASMHKKNIFLTLTYSDEHLKSDRLQYQDFQKFMKDLRERVLRDVTDPDLKKKLFIPFMVTGEYGDKNKRPHWHVLLFNYSPPDLEFHRTTELGHKVYKSAFIDALWGKNDPKSVPNEIGEITLESAGYVARYAAKKLTHGKDGDHDFHPKHDTSKRYALGKSWIEKNWEKTFQRGFVYLPGGVRTKIPRFYIDWLKKNHPDEWRRYVTETRLKLIDKAQKKNEKEVAEYMQACELAGPSRPNPIKKNDVRMTILKQKFKRLQEKLKL